MKKLFLVATLALSSLFASAQDGLQGTWFAGGAFSLGNTKVYDSYGDLNKTNTYSVTPLLGYFVSPTIAVGGAIGYEYSKLEEEVSTIGSASYTDETKNNTFVVMPLARKYWNVTGNLYFYGQVSLPVSFGSTKFNDNSDSKISTFGIQANVSPGFDWVVNNWFTVEASFILLSGGYSSLKPKGGDRNSSWSVNGNSISSSKFGDLTIGAKFLF